MRCEMFKLFTVIIIPESPIFRHDMKYLTKINLLRNYNIRTKLLISFGLLTTLFITSITIYHFTLNRVESAFQHLLVVEHNVTDQAVNLKILMLTCRKNEQNFLLYQDMIDADRVFQNIKTIQQKIAQIREFSQADNHPEINNHTQGIIADARSYDETFHKLVSAIQRKGLNENLGLQGKFQTIARELRNTHLSEHEVGPILVSLQKIQRYNHNQAHTLMMRELVRLEKMLNKYKARPIYLNKLNSLFSEYQQKVHLYLDKQSPTPVTIAALDDLIERMEDALHPLYVPDAKIMILQIRQSEKNYLLRGSSTYADQIHKGISNLQKTLKDNVTDLDDVYEMTTFLNTYEEKFDDLVAENANIDLLKKNLRIQAQAVERAADKIIHLAKQQDHNDVGNVSKKSNMAVQVALLICLAALLAGLALSILITQSISKPLETIMTGLGKMADGDYSARIKIEENNQTDIAVLARMFNHMADSITVNDWFYDGRNLLAEKLREDKEEQQLCRDIIVFLAEYLDLHFGTIYVHRDDNNLYLCGSYAYNGQLTPPQCIKRGEGLLGEAERGARTILLREVPPNYIKIKSSIGQSVPHSIIALPVIKQGKVLAVVELAALHPFSTQQIQFLESVSESIAIAINLSQQRTNTLELLQKTQCQSEELQTQQEELKTANEELEEQTKFLRRNEEELKAQQEELQISNEELEEKSNTLKLQNNNIFQKNKELENAKKDIEQKAQDLTNASRYKSEFLSNMSHELRTPLNSLLLLARNLTQNKSGNLQADQIKSADIIYNSGNDLLMLINDILDLSKIEAGRMDIAVNRVDIHHFADWLSTNFRHMTKDKNLDFSVIIDPSLPKDLITDRQRLEQVMRNLVSNAIKFTHSGGITIDFGRPAPTIELNSNHLERQHTLAIAVTDTGIGINEKKLQVIFDAFKQAEGGTSRKYGGTGLGLSISKQLTKLLGGEIQLISAEGKGSTFTIYLPFKTDKTSTEYFKQEPLENKIQEPVITSPSPPEALQIPDDREDLSSDDKVILIIEDDVRFTQILMDIAHKKGLKCLTSTSGSGGLDLAERYSPGAIILDICLPDIDGWQVMRSLKKNSNLRHIPIHIISSEEKTIKAFKKGAIGFLTKPVSEENLQKAFDCLEDALSNRMKDLLIVEDNEIMVQGIIDLVGTNDINIRTADTGKKAIADLQANNTDCMILDIGLPDMTGFTLLERLEEIPDFKIPPVIIYTGRELTKEENDSLLKYTDTIIIKGVKSEERLLDETALFLHRIISNLPHNKRQMIASLYDQDSMFNGKKILIADDDMRNAFALSKILEERGMEISIANDGKHALELLTKNSYDLILMDIMMPIMDGYETMERIRLQRKLHNLPIIALTAKAMTEDKEKCMAAGASDYLAKPVEEDRLLSMMRVWLYR